MQFEDKWGLRDKVISSMKDAKLNWLSFEFYYPPQNLTSEMLIFLWNDRFTCYQVLAMWFTRQKTPLQIRSLKSVARQKTAPCCGVAPTHCTGSNPMGTVRQVDTTEWPQSAGHKAISSFVSCLQLTFNLLLVRFITFAENNLAIQTKSESMQKAKRVGRVAITIIRCDDQL